MYLQSLITSVSDYFSQSILCIAEKDENGALGFVINRPYSRTLNELQEFSSLPSFPLYEGGPVGGEHLYFIHRRPDLIESGKPVGEGQYLGGDFKQAAAAIEKGMLHNDDIRIFIGYCGWDAGELEEEIRDGVWEIAETKIFL